MTTQHEHQAFEWDIADSGPMRAPGYCEEHGEVLARLSHSGPPAFLEVAECPECFAVCTPVKEKA